MDLRPTTDPLRSFLYCVGGWLCVGLAVVGALLPLVPTLWTSPQTPCLA